MTPLRDALKRLHYGDLITQKVKVIQTESALLGLNHQCDITFHGIKIRIIRIFTPFRP